MTKKLVIFGTGDIAELAHFYFSSDSDYQVVAFTVDTDYIEKNEFCGLPVIAFEEIVKNFPPNEVSFFVALSYSKINEIRKEKFLQAKFLGYKLATYVSSKATVLTQCDNIGENCFILEDNTIQPFVSIGDNVTLWSGNHIGHHSTISEHSFLASHIVVSGSVSIGKQCFIGVNATLRDNICVGERCVIGAGVLLLSDAEPEGVYVGQGTQRAKTSSSKLRRI
ncbi:transferase [Salinivibrio kushneri]|uniref:acetyltransferase n=1 Tax=Salinivibrio kushneri TaxID=1908198 RepID=UPI0009884034|nr:acetyltransferase [Salinivibrio kushneri]OOE39542.1 transferase [Salinivibrio kushneri]